MKKRNSIVLKHFDEEELATNELKMPDSITWTAEFYNQMQTTLDGHC